MANPSRWGLSCARRLLSSISGLCPLGASSGPQVRAEVSPDIAKGPWGQDRFRPPLPTWKTTVLEAQPSSLDAERRMVVFSCVDTDSFCFSNLVTGERRAEVFLLKGGQGRPFMEPDPRQLQPSRNLTHPGHRQCQPGGQVPWATPAPRRFPEGPLAGLGAPGCVFSCSLSGEML